LKDIQGNRFWIWHPAEKLRQLSIQSVRKTVFGTWPSNLHQSAKHLWTQLPVARMVEVSGLPICRGIQAAGKVFGAQKNISIQSPFPKS
jgi:hypothetical protein